MDYVTLNFNSIMSAVAVFFDTEKAFYTTWHSRLLYKLSESEFSESLISLIASFLTDRKFKFLVEGEFSTPRKITAGVYQGSLLTKILYSLYINDAPAAAGTHHALFADDTCIYATKKHERHVLCKSQHGLTAVKSWCECWNIKITEGKTQAIYCCGCNHHCCVYNHYTLINHYMALIYSYSYRKRFRINLLFHFVTIL
jgi:hypothetical protein